MITLENLTKAYWYRGKPKYIARDLNAHIPDGAHLLIGLAGTPPARMFDIPAASRHETFRQHVEFANRRRRFEKSIDVGNFGKHRSR